MLFSRIVSFFALSLTLGGVSLAKPVAEQPNLAAVQNVVTNLKASTDVIIPELKSLVSNNNVTAATAAPLLNQLINAVNTARQSINNVPRIVAIEKRQDDLSGIAEALADVITEIATIVADLLSAGGLPILGTLIPELSAALTTLVVSLTTIVAGLATVLSGLLSAVSGILGNVGLGLLLNILGLLGL